MDMACVVEIYIAGHQRSTTIPDIHLAEKTPGGPTLLFLHYNLQRYDILKKNPRCDTVNRSLFA